MLKYIKIALSILPTLKEIIFIKNNFLIKTNYKSKQNKNVALFLLNADHYFLLYWKILIFQIFRKKNLKIIGIWIPTIIRNQSKSSENFFFLNLSNFYYYLLKKKMVFFMAINWFL